MTSALLRRSRSFAQASRSEVTVLTFDDARDYRAIEEGLRAVGEIGPGVRCLNLWCWLEGVPGRAGMRTRTRFAADGTTVLQLDHLRADGALLVSDERAAQRSDGTTGRLVTLFDAEGAPVRSWHSIWGLYRFWLDALVGEDHAVLIADSKPAATFLTSYRRKKALTVHVVHGSHLDDDGENVRASRSEALEKIDHFDLLVSLTARQRRDLERSFGPSKPLAVIPNAIDIPAGFAQERDVSRGIVLASLISRKRVEDAITVVTEVRGARLDVYGGGPERASLEMRAGDRITFHGHVAGAAEHLERHSFLLVTSRSEGSPLAIMEAMAAGCIPIAYDIPYGPADLIDDGVTGFIVPDGSVGALAASVRTLLTMPERRVKRMRKAARSRAQSFREQAVLDIWERELAAAWRRKTK